MFQCCYSALGRSIFSGWFLKEGRMEALGSVTQSASWSVLINLGTSWFILAKGYRRLEICKILCSCRLTNKGDGGDPPDPANSVSAGTAGTWWGGHGCSRLQKKLQAEWCHCWHLRAQPWDTVQQETGLLYLCCPLKPFTVRGVG